MRIISEDEAIRLVLQSPDTFVCYAGAGLSREAGVKTAGEVCADIKDMLVKDSLPADEQDRLLAKLRWHHDSHRYAACIKAYGNQAARVGYFRGLLEGVKPAFCHHAVAMLVGSGVFRKSLLTTNFDKLLESAFTQQGERECQPIRSKREIEYWVREPDKTYVLKLHGDYDTYNIANTIDQIVKLDGEMQDGAVGLLESAGMMVLGAAGHEKSIHTFFDTLAEQAGPPKRVLDFGLLWGVYMGPRRPELFEKGAVEQEVDKSIGPEIRDLMDRMEAKNTQFAFFPVWGSGSFLLRLVDATSSKSLMSRARHYLDHDMRLGDVFERAGLEPEAIQRHLASLHQKRQRIDRLAKSGRTPKTILRGEGKTKDSSLISLRLVYGDITTRRMLDAEDVHDLRRAVVSPEDTCISAGGGVAYQLLRKAGPHIILNELAKLQPIPHGTTAVTSGGNLPVEYLFHGAALSIQSNGDYKVDKEAVKSTVQSALGQAEALGVEVIWLPLFGTGVAGFSPAQSLSGILEAIRLHRVTSRLLIHITIYSDDDMPRTTSIRAIKRVLGAFFDFADN